MDKTFRKHKTDLLDVDEPKKIGTLPFCFRDKGS